MDFLRDIFSYKDDSIVCGLTDELNILYINNYFDTHDENVLVVTNNLYDANKIFQRLKTYTDDVCLFPMDDFLSSVALAMSPDLKVKRLDTLEAIKKNKKQIVVTNLMGYLRFLPNKQTAKDLIIKLEKKLIVERDYLIEKLEEFGYRRDSLVTATGEYAVRGYIIDIFPIEATHPIRIEFFDDEIESIRVFDENTQLSINELTNVEILPFEEINSKDHSSLYEFMDNPLLIVFDEQQVLNGYAKILEDIKDYKKSKNIDDDLSYMYKMEDINVERKIRIETINNIKGSDIYNSKDIIKFKGDYDKFKDYVNLNYKNKILIICLSKEHQIRKVQELFPSSNYGSIIKGKINILNKKINEGFAISDYIFISEYDIDDIKVVNTYKNSFRMGRKIKSFDDIKVGDYVVHQAHGIGIYGGIKTIQKGDLIKDYILINYAGTDKVYVPVEKITSIYKYTDKDGTKPAISKLNSTQWAKTKLKVRNRLKDISEELIKLYAARMNLKGIAFNDYPDEIVFSSEFEYDETSDQTKCIKEIDKDLSSNIPMDRLLCGDVGFGKTEVAFRGMFKTVMNGFQVAYLCPTTLLSKQQYENAVERFKEFPINIALLNRFTSTREANRIFDGLEKGTIDIVFGTHRLFNQHIQYKKLGLLVIDEEQRFGVTHKEKIKELKNDVNVLTLSATPIPRTLKMAMSGLRDLSIIDTAPVNRYPVQTYVLEENEVLIKDAIYKELSRNGQVFILYNKVSDIEDERTRLAMLVPDAKIAIAHGQMDKNELEEVVNDFIEGKYDILLCTTIIETGIDIPNVNTLIIKDADQFGLSQLYQLRGRVGRSDKIAYAYLMYKPAKVLTETAIKRLKSIKDFTELGSGYKIAMRDLSIRGAGDLLGSEQAGFVDTVGIDLYTQMLNDEINRLNGVEVPEEEVEANPLIEVSNHISDEYVSDESLKIEIHKLINEIKDEESLENVKKEIEDRFGKINEELEIYMYEEWFEKLAQKVGIERVEKNDTYINLIVNPDTSSKIQGDKLFLISYNINPKFRLSYRLKRIQISLTIINQKEHFIIYLVRLLNEILNMIKE